MAFTDKQAKFCREYLIDLNATQAAVRAGYTPTFANRTGPKVLANVGVAAEIARLQAEQAERTEITADRVIQELARLAFSDPRTIYATDGRLKQPAEWDDDTAAAVASVETEEHGEGRATVRKVKRWDKKGALELLGKHLGLFRDKIELSGPGGSPIPVMVYIPSNGRENVPTSD